MLKKLHLYFLLSIAGFAQAMDELNIIRYSSTPTSGLIIQQTGIGKNATTEMRYDQKLADMLASMNIAEQEYYAQQRAARDERVANEAAKKAQEEESFGLGLVGLKGAFGGKKSTRKK